MTIRSEVIPFSSPFFARIEGFWRHLLSTTGDPSAFLSAEWMSAWLELYGERARPTAIVWRDEADVPVGCVLVSQHADRIGPVPVTRGYLNASAPMTSCEHNDVLARPDVRADVVSDLARCLRALGVDEVALVGVRERLAEELRRAWPVQHWEGYYGQAPYIPLDDVRASGLPYLAFLSSNTRAQIRRSVRLYESIHGPCSLRRARTAAEAQAWLSELVSLHEARWRSVGERGAFHEEHARHFHEKLVGEALADRGEDCLVVDLLRVTFGDRSIGVLYNLRYRSRVCFLQCGLDYEGDNRLKPGLVAHAAAIGHYTELGTLEYDFLGGEPEPVQYKTSLTTHSRTLAWIQLPSPTLKMGILNLTREVGRGLRQLMT